MRRATQSALSYEGRSQPPPDRLPAGLPMIRNGHDCNIVSLVKAGES